MGRDERGLDRPTRYWIGVVSRSHVHRGVAGGFAQLCHGKHKPLARMNQGDWLIYYSPKSEMNGGENVQAFTAIGRLADEEIFPYPMSETFVPFRRRVHYLPCEEASIKVLLPQLTFIPNTRSWGYPFRFGHFEIPECDYRTITAVMKVEGSRFVGKAEVADPV